MIIGLGNDICNINRIEKAYQKYGAMFIKRCYGKDEREELNDILEKKDKLISSLAKRFAAKEAFVKALGTGFSQGIGWSEIEIVHDKNGKPQLQISGKAEEILKQKVDSWHLWVSLSDDEPWAEAVVVIESDYV